LTILHRVLGAKRQTKSTNEACQQAWTNKMVNLSLQHPPYFPEDFLILDRNDNLSNPDIPTRGYGFSVVVNAGNFSL
jgi:hypothetical protein